MVFEPYNYGRLYYEPSPFLKPFHCLERKTYILDSYHNC